MVDKAVRTVDPVGVLLLLTGDEAHRTPCQVVEDDWWFDQTPEGVETAKALCGPCPVREDCLSAALRRREPWGVWGGHLLRSGAVLARQPVMGRPRKDDARRVPAA